MGTNGKGTGEKSTRRQRRNKPHSGRRLAKRLAHEVIAELDLSCETVVDQEFYTGCLQACRRKVDPLRVESQGLLLATGASYRDLKRQRTALYEVHGGTWVHKHDSGREILLQGAATAVMAILLDLLPTFSNGATARLIERLSRQRRGDRQPSAVM